MIDSTQTEVKVPVVDSKTGRVKEIDGILRLPGLMDGVLRDDLYTPDQCRLLWYAEIDLSEHEEFASSATGGKYKIYFFDAMYDNDSRDIVVDCTVENAIELASERTTVITDGDTRPVDINFDRLDDDIEYQIEVMAIELWQGKRENEVIEAIDYFEIELNNIFYSHINSIRERDISVPYITAMCLSNYDDRPIRHVVLDNGTELWLNNGRVHNDNGPVAIDFDGEEMYWMDGEHKRLDGPRTIHSDE